MSATGNELVKLSQLRGTINELRSAMQSTSLTDTNNSITRTTGGSLAIKDGQELVKKVSGQSYVWNQLVQNGNFETSSNWSSSGSTISISNNIGIFIASERYGRIISSSSFSLQSNHKYLVKSYIKTTASNNIYLTLGGNNYFNVLSSDWQEIGGIFTQSSTATSYLAIGDNRQSDWDNVYVKNVVVFDLTAMGLGNITTVAQFKALFPNDYYDFNSGTLVSSNNEYMNIGRNLWDEEWELGKLNTTNGTNASSTNQFRSKNYIQVIGGKYYYIKDNYGGLAIVSYDSNKNFLEYIGAKHNEIVGIASNVAYLRFYCDGTTYNHDICINKSDASFNGTYEPYQSNLLSYNGTLERKVGSVKLKDLTWTKDGEGYFQTTQTTMAIYTSPNAVNPLISNTYNVVSANEVRTIDKTIGYYSASTGTNSYLRVRDNTYTDATAFKNHFTDDDVLLYELATPTTETIVNATNVELRGVGTSKDTLSNESGIACWKDGTTTQVNKNGIVAIPYSVSEEFAVSINGQLSNNAQTDLAQEKEIQELKDRMFFTDDSTKNPAQIYGGNWTQVGTQTIDTTTIYVWKKGV